MSTILMLKDREVYDVTTGFVYSRRLLPTPMEKYQGKETFSNWWRSRKSSSTNVTSRLLSSRAFGNNKKVIDVTTRGLSLSDCYWLKDSSENITFKEVSPYYADFWKGTGVYKGHAIPTLYVDGFLTKEWVSSELLRKPYNRLEYEAYLLGHELGMDVAEYIIEDDCVLTVNFTSPDIMLDQASNIRKYFDGEYDSLDIISDFDNGFDMLVLDAIIGNGDRHAGNFGRLLKTDTCELYKAAPIYDFDHALDSKNPETCVLIRDLLLCCSLSTSQKLRIKNHCKKAINLNINPEFTNRARYILTKLDV